MNDMVNHPPHYTQGKFETIEVLEDKLPNDPLLFIATQYILRSAHKGAELQDLEKAQWYLQRRISKLKVRQELDACSASNDKPVGSLSFIVKHEDFYNKKFGKPYEAIDKYNETYAAEYQDAEQNDCSLTWRMNTYAEFNSIERKMYKSFERYAKRG